MRQFRRPRLRQVCDFASCAFVRRAFANRTCAGRIEYGNYTSFEAGRVGNTVLYDMHCHMDFARDTGKLAREAAACDIAAFSVTVTPGGYTAARTLLDPWPQFRVGLGLHPWWVADGRIKDEDIACFERLAANERFIGEVGLDFAHGRSKTSCRTRQMEVLERALASACATQPKAISLHAVHATGEVLDALECAGALERCICIFHWFSGSFEKLQRAIGAGCYFSLGPRMLATKRGQAYARAIPADRILLETDTPAQPDTPWSMQAWHEQLANALAALAEARSEDAAALGASLAATSSRILEG